VAATTTKHSPSGLPVPATDAGIATPDERTQTITRQVTLTAERPSRPRSHRGMALGGALAVVLVALAVGARELLAHYQPHLLARWDHLLRRPLEQQITGFAMLGLIGISLLLPLARGLGARGRRLWTWRGVHVALGLAGLAALVAHSSLRLGTQLNLWLTIVFLSASLLGAICSLGMGGTPGLRSWLAAMRRLHVALLWPLLALVGLHVLAAYYF
jgi:nitrite reductase (NADH) large subunit